MDWIQDTMDQVDIIRHQAAYQRQLDKDLADVRASHKRQCDLNDKQFKQITAMKLKISNLTEGLELIADKAPWCDCMDTAKIAENALKAANEIVTES